MEIRVAAVQYCQRPIESFDEFVSQLNGYVSMGVEAQADVILFPELFTVQLLSLHQGLSAEESLDPFIRYTEQVYPILKRLSKEHSLVIIAGSMLVPGERGPLNVSTVFYPTGETFQQPKLHPTPYERDTWNLQGGDTIGTFEIKGVRCGIAICYDIEFPEVARTLAENGAQVIFVPFWTELQYGALRVRYCSQGAAVSNQCYVVTAGNSGSIPGVPAAQINYAQSGVFTPLDHGFPRDGIAAQLEPNIESVVVCDIDLDILRFHREEGTVTLLKDRRTDLFTVNSQARVVSQ